MSKRKRFVLTSTTLSLGFLGIQFIEGNLRYLAIVFLSVLSAIFFIWSLREGLGINLTLIILILPFFFTLSVGLFWFLLPMSLFTKIPVVLLYFIGIYVLCLTTNIYTVSAIRTIALLRAAKGVGFVFSLLISFLLFDTILSFKAPVWLTTGAVFLASFPLFFQGLWIIGFEEKITWLLIRYSLVFSLILAEIALSLFFWPVTVAVGSLFLTIGVYILLGLGQAKFEGRLFPETTREYLVLGAIVFLGMFLATRWGI